MRQAQRLARNSPLPERLGSPNSSRYLARNCPAVIRPRVATVCSTSAIAFMRLTPFLY